TEDLSDMLGNTRLWQVAADIEEGVRMCARECEYFEFCFGGAPSNKLFENGTFASTETMYCRHTVQLPLDIVLADLEAELNLPEVHGNAKTPRGQLSARSNGFSPPIGNADKLVQ